MRTVFRSETYRGVEVTTVPAVHEVIHRPLVIALILNDGSRVVASHKFSYRLDPVFENIKPRNHLIMCVILCVVNGEFTVGVCVILTAVSLINISINRL